MEGLHFFNMGSYQIMFGDSGAYPETSALPYFSQIVAGKFNHLGAPPNGASYFFTLSDEFWIEPHKLDHSVHIVTHSIWLINIRVYLLSGGGAGLLAKRGQAQVFELRRDSYRRRYGVLYSTFTPMELNSS